MTDLYAQTWFDHAGTRSHKGKGCANNADEISRRRHGKSGKRRHDCVLATHNVGSSRVDLQACKLEYSIVSPK